MRRMAILSLAIAGIFIIASASASRANWYHKSGSSEGTSSGMTSPSDGSMMESPQAGTYEGQGPTEAGRLPSGENTLSSGSDFRGDGSVQVSEAGGAEFRIGIDSGP